MKKALLLSLLMTISLFTFSQKTSTSEENTNTKEQITSPILEKQNEKGSYNGYNYEYYENAQKKAISQKKVGMGVTLGGLGVFFIGAVMAVSAGYDEETETFENESLAMTGGLLEIGGIITAIVGTPIWISGGAKYRKATDGMGRCSNQNVSLNIGTTSNGLGLVVKF
ncbi:MULTISPECIES: hypothetical protein [unclassified Lentimicrobium]|uniref:hypothetical protein n=1 Tax=unclassified Lentimicrobium TaxID=2677434 RepID=UPI001551E2D4|nr:MULTISPECIES: hypothetical protein [unclassified Lentimicrobium]NPD48200.1 hypothetical protein [Lentimicrobium sp. S6]NPD86837.1 hypothetical protein [Lentimicrobium sp. L6]